MNVNVTQVLGQGLGVGGEVQSRGVDDDAVVVFEFVEQQFQRGQVFGAVGVHTGLCGQQLKLAPSPGTGVVEAHQGHSLAVKGLRGLACQSGAHERLAHAAGATQGVNPTPIGRGFRFGHIGHQGVTNQTHALRGIFAVAQGVGQQGAQARGNTRLLHGLGQRLHARGQTQLGLPGLQLLCALKFLPQHLDLLAHHVNDFCAAQLLLVGAEFLSADRRHHHLGFNSPTQGVLHRFIKSLEWHGRCPLCRRAFCAMKANVLCLGRSHDVAGFASDIGCHDQLGLAIDLG